MNVMSFDGIVPGRERAPTATLTSRRQPTGGTASAHLATGRLSISVAIDALCWLAGGAQIAGEDAEAIRERHESHDWRWSVTLSRAPIRTGCVPRTSPDRRTSGLRTPMSGEVPPPRASNSGQPLSTRISGKGLAATQVGDPARAMGTCTAVTSRSRR
jgi:hypothetical protein